MFQNVQKKLIFLYVLTAGIILTIALGITAFFYVQTSYRQQESVFQTNISNFISRLQSSNYISDSWLEELELQEHLIIHLEENDVPLHYRGSYEPKTDRASLLSLASSHIQETYRKESILSSSPYQSPLFDLKGSYGDRYLGTYLTLSIFGTTVRITLLNDITWLKAQFIQKLAYFLLLELLCLLSLYWIGRFFVRHMLKPIQENERLQNEFVSAASHELRTPIMLIQGSADSLLTFPEKTDYFHRLIRSECRRMTVLVSDLLVLTSAKNTPIKPTAIDPATLLLELYESYLPLFEAKKLSLTIELTDEFSPILGSDPFRISQILRIFLDNAMAYSPAGTAIILKEVLLKNRIVFQVIDHGPGIPNEDKKQIYQKFYRRDKSRTDKEHFGLGLSIAQKYAQQIGAMIQVKDTPGGGCTFSLVISSPNRLKTKA